MRDDVAFVGIDPGRSGGAACLRAAGGKNSVSTFYAPYDSQGGHLDGLRGWLRNRIAESRGSVVVLEKVWSSPQMGVVSAFSFGESYGAVQGVLAGMGIPVQYVLPRTWMRALGIPPRDGKETQSQFKLRLLERAESEFCGALGAAWQTMTKRYRLAICDALLIALYARQEFGE